MVWELITLAQAMEQGNMEGARIYAQNAIREKNQSLNYLRLSSRIDGVASRVEGAIRMRTVIPLLAVLRLMKCRLQVPWLTL